MRQTEKMHSHFDKKALVKVLLKKSAKNNPEKEKIVHVQ